jgi:hypothetical protein
MLSSTRLARLAATVTLGAAVAMAAAACGSNSSAGPYGGRARTLGPSPYGASW